MKLRSTLRALALVAGFAAAGAATPAFAQTPHPGEATYKARCASCHDNPAPETRAANLSTIQGMSPERLREVMTTGVMAPMSAGITPNDMTNLIGFLTKDQKSAAAAWDQAMLCAPDKRTVDLVKPSMTMFGADLKSSRHLPAAEAGISTADMKSLDVAWTVGFPKVQAMGAAPVVIGSTVFMNGGGKLMALDADAGCAKWIYDGGPSRSSLTYGEIEGRKVVIYTAGRGEVHVVDAKTGGLVWKAPGTPVKGEGSVRAAVVLYRDKIIVPISASGVASGMNAKFECCTGHGAVVALSAKDGSRLWEYHTMPDAEYNGQVSPAGVKQKGPSGAPIWTTPTIDVKRNRVIVTTGENTSWPATDTSDAVIAIDLDTGKQVWGFQAMESDVWNMACRSSDADSGPNCPWHQDEKNIGRDFDFGGSAILSRTRGGLFGLGAKDVLLAGQKSGDLWALDAETGKVLWNKKVGEGSPLGGNHWGIAADKQRVYLTIADSIPVGAEQKPGVYAFDISTGKELWGFSAKPDCGPERKARVINCELKYGFSATPMVVDGAVVAGTLDGKLYAFDGKTGEVLFQRDFAGDIATNNGVEGKAGSFDAHAIAAGNGTVYVQPGYGSFSQTPGNVLIALKPKR